MKSIDVIIIVTYFLVILLVGYIGSKKAKTSDDYIVAGRRLGFFMYVGCMSAVILGGASTIGTSQLGYEYGISGIWLVVMLGLGVISIGLFLVNKIFGLKVLTISELLKHRYNSQTGLISAFVAAVYALLVSATQVIAMGTILHVLLGWSQTVSMIIVGSIVLIYTILGGMWAVSMTDIIQFIVMTIGIIFLMLPISLHAAGGITHLKETLPASYFNLTSIGIDTIIQYLFLFCLGIIVGQDIWQRVFTAKTKRVAQYGNIFAGIYSFIYAISIALIGTSAFVVLPHLTNSQNSFAAMALSILPNGVLGIVLASVVSALMSTASGTILASSTLVSNDIIPYYKKDKFSEKGFLRLSRMITTIIGLLSIIIAVWLQNVLVALDVAYAVLSGSLFFPIILGFFWKRATAKAALFSIIGSSIAILIGLFVKGISSTEPIMYGLFVSAVLMVVVSLRYQKGVSSKNSSRNRQDYNI